MGNHFSVFTQNQDKNKNYAQWPSLLVSLRGKDYVVSVIDSARAHALPPIGAKLIACEHQPPSVWMRNHIFKFREDPQQLASWPALAPYLLIDEGNPWMHYPRHCTFEVNGQPITYRLDWVEAPSSTLTIQAIKAGYGTQEGFHIEPLEKGGIWVFLPIFQIETDQEKKSIEVIIQKLTHYKDVPYIVLDLRGNSGGDRMWGQKIIETLYGKAYIVSLGEKHFLNQIWTVDWRVSVKNLAFYQQTQNDPVMEDRFKSALTQGELFVRDSWKRLSCDPLSTTAPDIPFKGKLYVLTDGRCSSAAWQFFIRTV